MSLKDDSKAKHWEEIDEEVMKIIAPFKMVQNELDKVLGRSYCYNQDGLCEEDNCQCYD